MSSLAVGLMFCGQITFALPWQLIGVRVTVSVTGLNTVLVGS